LQQPTVQVKKKGHAGAKPAHAGPKPKPKPIAHASHVVKSHHGKRK
jgi:hypothetical protein